MFKVYTSLEHACMQSPKKVLDSPCQRFLRKVIGGNFFLAHPRYIRNMHMVHDPMAKESYDAHKQATDMVPAYTVEHTSRSF